MKTKTINKILSARFDAWLASITDEPTRALAKGNTIITGGCIVSLLLKENVNDFDLYFRTEETALAIAKYYCGVFAASEAGKGYEIEAVSNGGRVTISIAKSKTNSTAGDPDTVNVPEADDGTEVVADADEIPAVELEAKAKDSTPRYHPLFLSSNAITLSTKVQCIIRFCGEPDEIHENYDFVHCTSYWASWTRSLKLRPEALEAILGKELRYVGSKYPICSIIRTRKFIARGWTINAGQFVKMCWQVSKLDLANIDVLKDQLVGVDSAYFNQLIWGLTKQQNEKLEKDPNTSRSVDGGYLMTLIDKIF